MAIKAWAPLLAWLVLAGAAITGLFVEHPEPYNRSQPTVAPYKDSPRAKLAAGTHTDNQNDKKGEQERSWIEGLFDKPTDTLLVIFNGLLVLFTGLLYRATSGLFKETAELRRIADEQRVDLSRSITAAEKSAEVAERTLIAANRPWVKVDIHVGGPIFYNVNGANFTMNYVLKNVGKSPATNVWINAQIFAPAIGLDDNFDLRAKQLEIIFGLKTRPPSPFGFALFPGDVISQGIIVSIPADELERITQKAEFIIPTIIGAIDYRSSFSQGSHQTGFIVEVRRSDKPRPISTEKKRHPAAIFSDEGDIPAAEIRLFRSFLEGGYAD